MFLWDFLHVFTQRRGGAEIRNEKGTIIYIFENDKLIKDGIDRIVNGL